MSGNTFKTNYFFCGGTLAVMLALTPAATPYAQGAGDEVIEEIITIGTPGGRGVERQQASFALTTMDSEDIAKFSPKSTADLLKSARQAVFVHCG